jgi:hypothetical protein
MQLSPEDLALVALLVLKAQVWFLGTQVLFEPYYEVGL